MEKLARILRELEEHSGLPEIAYCRKLGIPRTTYRTWKYGGIPKNFMQFLEIIKFHKISFDNLIRRLSDD